MPEEEQHELNTYEAPRALRLGTAAAGQGDCAPGSGDALKCDTGNVAAEWCAGAGNSADTCDLSGSLPGGT